MSTASTGLMQIAQGKAIDLNKLPELSAAAWRVAILGAVAKGWRVSTLFAHATALADAYRLLVIMADDEQNHLHLGSQLVQGGSFASLSAECPQVQLFEREIAEQFGLVPLGHPWFKPLRFHHSWTNRDAWGRDKLQAILPGVQDFYQVEGEQVHEVAVGPVHAGVIEPGHFRFQCHGEEVFHLEIALGYQHRGVESALIGGPNKLSLHHAETLAGDTTIGHTISYCQNIEALAGVRVHARTQAVRGIALELERLANHVGDLGALSGDIGFLPTASFCGRIRGDFLNMTALLCGNRFGRGLVVPGGIGFDLDEARAAELLARVDTAAKESESAINLLWDNQSVMARFEDTGQLKQEQIIELGIVGPVARAAGVARDIRFNHPSGIYRMAQIPVSTTDTGDVFARAYVRWLEIQQSITFIREQLSALPKGTIRQAIGSLAPDRLVVSLNEGWRGEICHVAITDSHGRFARYKVVDPSFHNWYGLAMAMRNQEISDFPLCNKSFNLSYCGHDL